MEPARTRALQVPRWTTPDRPSRRCGALAHRRAGAHPDGSSRRCEARCLAPERTPRSLVNRTARSL
eukprot:7613039-Alexandrium_andersonii.AAC.1